MSVSTPSLDTGMLASWLGDDRTPSCAPNARDVRPEHGAWRVPSRIVEVERGRFDPASMLDCRDGCLGVLVLTGFIHVELAAGRGRAAWLIGSDDLLRPWQLEEISLTSETDWSVLSQTRLAVLDREFHRSAAASPALLDQLLSRAISTANWLLAKSLIISSPLVEERLLMWFSLAAERWGKVTPDGVLLDLPLTHELLAALVGARRPTVTGALRSLQASGLLTRAGRRQWLLTQAVGVPGTRLDGALTARCIRMLGLDLYRGRDGRRPGGLSSLPQPGGAHASSRGAPPRHLPAKAA